MAINPLQSSKAAISSVSPQSLAGGFAVDGTVLAQSLVRAMS